MSKQNFQKEIMEGGGEEGLSKKSRNIPRTKD